ncbi:unnamed protein product [Symbiodinium sp. CCMP2592]|nr:unnamed protein product [Symbiodinium sp. CCMP2592]
MAELLGKVWDEALPTIQRRSKRVVTRAGHSGRWSLVASAALSWSVQRPGGKNLVSMAARGGESYDALVKDLETLVKETESGLPHVALGLLKPITEKYVPDTIVHADLWTLAANVAMKVKVGRLPDGAKEIDHFRAHEHIVSKEHESNLSAPSAAAGSEETENHLRRCPCKEELSDLRRLPPRSSADRDKQEAEALAQQLEGLMPAAEAQTIKALAFRAAWFTANQRRFNFADAAEDQRAVEFYADLLASLTNPEQEKNIKSLSLNASWHAANTRSMLWRDAREEPRRRESMHSRDSCGR